MTKTATHLDELCFELHLELLSLLSLDLLPQLVVLVQQPSCGHQLSAFVSDFVFDYVQSIVSVQHA